MNIINVTRENLEREHICCAISNNNDCQVASKKAWLAERFDDGLVFKKCDVRGKCFIEYIPAERAWAPIEASGYMYINCLWVAGQFKGQGNSNLLFEECLRDSEAQGKKGICLLSSQKKKMPFLADPKYLAHKGFLTADTAAPYFSLMYLPLGADSEAPRFRECVKQPKVTQQGFVIYYAHQCPYTAKYVPLLEAVARENEVPFTAVHIDSFQAAQAAPTPFTSFTLFYNGKFVTHETLSEPKFAKIIGECKNA